MRRTLLLTGPVSLVLALAGCAVSQPSSRAPAVMPAAGHTSSHLTHTFLSLWPACACGRTTVLKEFSLRSGRPVRQLGRFMDDQATSVATPHVDRRDEAWLTFSSGPKCTSGAAGCGPAPDSCAGHVEGINLRSDLPTTELTFPSSQQVTDVVPSPDGGRAVELAAGCATSFFNQHLIVRNLHTGHELTLGAGARPCHDLGTPAWSADGSRLVFAYGPSALGKRRAPPAGTCEMPRPNRLVIVSARHSSKVGSWHLLKAQRGCSYQVASFDRGGVAAVEGCVQGSPKGQRSINLGDAYLLQLNHRDKVITRLALKPGWEDGAISTEPDGMVLVSQDQPANAGYPERDWVWQFTGRKLREVASYRARDAAQVIAVST